MNKLKQRLHIYLDKDLHSWLKAKAKKDFRSINHYVAKLITKERKRDEKDEI